MPTCEQVAATWACLAACWRAGQLVQQQHEAAMGSSAAPQAAPEDDQAALQLSTAMQQLAAKLDGSGAEAVAAEVQYVASKGLLEVCQAAAQAATAASASVSAVVTSAEEGGTNSSTHGARMIHTLQLQLAALQAAMSEYEQSGLAYVLDPSTSTMSDELPEAAVDLEDLLDAGDAEQVAAAMKAQQPSHQQQWQQQLLAASTQLQVMSQLMVAIRYEALAPIAAWQAAAAAAASTAGSAASTGSLPDEGFLLPMQQREQQQQLVLLPAGPVSQQQLWLAAASHIQQHWQQLQQLLSQAMELEGHMHALAAVAAVGGAAAVWPEDVELMSQAIALQQLLLPQGFDVLTTDECVTSAQLLQAQWTELEQLLWAALADCLCPLLGLHGSPQLQHGSMPGTAAAAASAEAGLAVLRQLLEAAAAGTAGASIMHCKDVLEALAVGSAAAASGSMWGVPGLSDAWRCLVVLLLQYGCLQQQLLQQQRQLHGVADGADHTDAVPDSGVDVLRSSRALPLDIEGQRPLFIVVQALHELLCSRSQEGLSPAPASSASATDGGGATVAATCQVSLQQQLQDILLPPLLQHQSAVLEHHLDSLQQHLGALASEATGVLSRFQQQQQTGARVQQRDLTDDTAGMNASALDAFGTGDEPGPELVPFDAFDTSLEGADMMLEELGGEGEEQEQGDSPLAAGGSSQQGAAAAGQLQELVPFDAFDEGLPGADMVLEELGGDDGGAGDDGGGFFGALGDAGDDGDLLGGALEPDGDGGGGSHVDEVVAADDRRGSQGALQDTTAAAVAEVEALAQQLMAAGRAAAAVALQQQQLAGLQQVEASCVWQQQVWLRHVAAFEWLWGDLLEQQRQQEKVQEAAAAVDDAAAGKASTPSQQQQLLLEAAAAALQAPESVHEHMVTLQPGPAAAGCGEPGAAYQLYCAGLLSQLPANPALSGSTTDSHEQTQEQQQQRMPTSSELLQSWQLLCEQQAAVADALQAWRAGCAAAAGAVGEVLLGPPHGVQQAAAGSPPPALQVTDPSVCHKVSVRVALQRKSMLCTALRGWVCLLHLGPVYIQQLLCPSVCMCRCSRRVLAALCYYLLLLLLQMLSGHVARASHWLTAAAGLCSSLTQQAEASLQLEYSRRGRLWAPGNAT